MLSWYIACAKDKRKKYTHCSTLAWVKSMLSIMSKSLRPNKQFIKHIHTLDFPFIFSVHYLQNCQINFACPRQKTKNSSIIFRILNPMSYFKLTSWSFLPEALRFLQFITTYQKSQWFFLIMKIKFEFEHQHLKINYLLYRDRYTVTFRERPVATNDFTCY
jgi:hypothetical protein